MEIMRKRKARMKKKPSLHFHLTITKSNSSIQRLTSMHQCLPGSSHLYIKFTFHKLLKLTTKLLQ